MSSLIPANSFLSNSSSGRQGNALTRQIRRDIDQIAAHVELESTAEQARAFLVASAMNNVSTLVMQAEAHMKVAPAGAPFYEALITSYAVSAGQRLSRL